MILLAVDSNSILNRAFYGVKMLSTREGMYTNAVFGFLNIMERMRAEEQPDALCVAFDLKGPTFRHLQYDGYKATRQPMPEALSHIPDGQVMTMGSLYLDGKAKPLPQEPDWCGDIPQYLGKGKLSVGDTDPDPKNQLKFIKVKHFLICDRNLMTCISWDTLASFGLVHGQAPTLEAVIRRAKDSHGPDKQISTPKSMDIHVDK